MSSPDFYSDRMNGPVSRTFEVLPDHTSAALLSLVDSKASSHWLASQFPERCENGRSSIAGTDEGALAHSLQGLIPGIEWPLWRNQELPDATVFDVVEFAASRVALPIEGRWHDYMNHHELSFKEQQGRRQFFLEVNQLLARGGTIFELSGNRIERIGTPLVREVLSELRSNSGDSVLDGLVSEAFTRYRSRHESDRALALEKLWDAFERLKTVEIPGGDKKASIAALLSHVKTEQDRIVLDSEMTVLTNIGNQFMIRHHETGKHAVSAEMREYLFARMGSLVILLLRESGRLQ